MNASYIDKNVEHILLNFYLCLFVCPGNLNVTFIGYYTCILYVLNLPRVEFFFFGKDGTLN